MARRMRKYPAHVSLKVVYEGPLGICPTYEIWDEKEDVLSS